jgi:hypothetical protein
MRGKCRAQREALRIAALPLWVVHDRPCARWHMVVWTLPCVQSSDGGKYSGSTENGRDSGVVETSAVGGRTNVEEDRRDAVEL